MAPVAKEVLQNEFKEMLRETLQSVLAVNQPATTRVSVFVVGCARSCLLGLFDGCCRMSSRTKSRFVWD